VRYIDYSERVLDKKEGKYYWQLKLPEKLYKLSERISKRFKEAFLDSPAIKLTLPGKAKVEYQEAAELLPAGAKARFKYNQMDLQTPDCRNTLERSYVAGKGYLYQPRRVKRKPAPPPTRKGKAALKSVTKEKPE